jgi:hypothetical protein
MMDWEERLRASMERTLNVPVFTGTPIEGLTDEEAEKQDRDRFPQAMIEGSTEYDWADLPDWLKDVMRNAADEFRRWADTEPIKGEVIRAQFEVEQ